MRDRDAVVQVVKDTLHDWLDIGDITNSMRVLNTLVDAGDLSRSEAFSIWWAAALHHDGHIDRGAMLEAVDRALA